MVEHQLVPAYSTPQLQGNMHTSSSEFCMIVAAPWVVTHTDNSPLLYSSYCKETALCKLVLALQDLVGCRPLLSCV